MNTLRVTMGLTLSDRTISLIDGSAQPRGLAVIPIVGSADEIFFRMLNHREFDVCEMSFAAYTMKVARGETDLVAVPAFLSRSFRHGSAYVLDESPLRSFESLDGLRIGAPEYQMTSNVWLRDLWSRDYRVDLSSLRWFVGGLDKPGRRDRIPLSAPTGVPIATIGQSRTLVEMLRGGELDLIASPDAPAEFEQGNGIRRILPDSRATEVDYFLRTGIFPIMHVVVLRRELLDEAPWAARELFLALERARMQAFERLRGSGHLTASLAWLVDAEREQRRLLGDDFWSYGLARNRSTVESFLAACHDQGLTERLLHPDELFVSSAENEGDY